MKQLCHDLRTGEVKLLELPSPAAGPGEILIRSSKSLVSSGTERMLVDFARAGWLAKARQQPGKVKEVLQRARTDGVVATIEAVASRLEQPLVTGYCNVGTVEELGSDVQGLEVGARVASNGAHADLVKVPKNLCARVPEVVSDEQAAFAIMGAIGLQGVRLAQPTLGECFVVTGLGLVGLMTAQILKANGCRVLGIDPDPARVELVRTFGAEGVDLARGEDPVGKALEFSRARGVDGVLMTLAGRSSEPLSQAARMCRKRGRIVLVGVTGLEIDRAEFYEKELTFQVSCSYGPGRYDPAYENEGHDYPLGFVRWTEQRNLEAVLDMMADGRLDVSGLVTHRFEFNDAAKAYELIADRQRSHLGVILDFPRDELETARTVIVPGVVDALRREPRLAFIGAGNYAGRVLIPAFSRTGASMISLASQGGVNAAHYARKFRFEQITTDTDAVFANEEIDAVVVATRHDSHAAYVLASLSARKHVFVEKPLALTLRELKDIESACLQGSKSDAMARLLMVGFNRRFSKLTAKAKALLETIRAPKAIVMTINAGSVGASHWTHDRRVGGGRIVGEACHFIDLARYLVGCPIRDYSACGMGGAGSRSCDENAVLSLRFEDGSVASINYFASGHRLFPKERIDVFCEGRALRLDNFLRLTGYGWPGFRRLTLLRQDKGQDACARAFVSAIVDGGAAPIPVAELLEVGRVSIDLAEEART